MQAFWTLSILVPTHICCIDTETQSPRTSQGPKGELEITLTPYVTIEQVRLSRILARCCLLLYPLYLPHLLTRSLQYTE